jgi:hypothetical protein
MSNLFAIFFIATMISVIIAPSAPSESEPTDFCQADHLSLINLEIPDSEIVSRLLEIRKGLLISSGARESLEEGLRMVSQEDFSKTCNNKIQLNQIVFKKGTLSKKFKDSKDFEGLYEQLTTKFSEAIEALISSINDKYDIQPALDLKCIENRLLLRILSVNTSTKSNNEDIKSELTNRFKTLTQFIEQSREESHVWFLVDAVGCLRKVYNKFTGLIKEKSITDPEQLERLASRLESLIPVVINDKDSDVLISFTDQSLTSLKEMNFKGPSENPDKVEDLNPQNQKVFLCNVIQSSLKVLISKKKNSEVFNLLHKYANSLIFGDSEPNLNPKLVEFYGEYIYSEVSMTGERQKGGEDEPAASRRAIMLLNSLIHLQTEEEWVSKSINLVVEDFGFFSKLSSGHVTAIIDFNHFLAMSFVAKSSNYNLILFFTREFYQHVTRSVKADPQARYLETFADFISRRFATSKDIIDKVLLIVLMIDYHLTLPYLNKTITVCLSDSFRDEFMSVELTEEYEFLFSFVFEITKFVNPEFELEEPDLLEGHSYRFKIHKFEMSADQFMSSKHLTPVGKDRVLREIFRIFKGCHVFLPVQTTETANPVMLI